MRVLLRGLGRSLAVGLTCAVIALVYLFVVTRGRWM
ncbi:hypothetical protein B9W62_13750 [Streptomyces sp. CS113]|nr:hypothetical protein B9W62_13750 [Streptomyces sp. CS113]